MTLQEQPPQPLHWFNRQTGELIVGEAALSMRLEESGIGDIMPLGELITSNSAQTAAYNLERKHYPEWQPDDYLQYGRWVLSVIDTQTNESHLALRHFHNLYHAGLGPSRKGITKQFKNFTNFRDLINPHIVRTYGRGFSDWQTSDFVDYTRTLAATIGRKPKAADYQAAFRRGGGPSVSMIHKCGQAIDQLNALIGYPDIKTWSDDDYINWGVRTLRANPGTWLTQAVLMRLSNQGLGPSRDAILRRFGRQSDFQQLVWKRLAAHDQRYEQQRRQRNII